MSTFSRSATSAALRSGRTLKPMMMAFDAAASSTSDSLIAPTAEWMILIFVLSSDSLPSVDGQHFGRALHVGLDDDRQLLDVALGQLAPAAIRASGGRPWRRARVPWPATAGRSRSAAPSPDRPPTGTNRRARAGVSRPSTSTGVDGPATLSARPRSSMSARTRPTTGPAMMLSPTRSEPSWTSTVATGPRPRSSLVSSTVPSAARFGIGLVLADVGDEQDHLEQQVEALLLLGRDLDEHRRAAPLFGHEVEVGELPLDRFRIRARLVDLVDRDDDRHVRRARVIDRFSASAASRRRRPRRRGRRRR